MIKVRVTRGAAVGLTGASGLVAFSSGLGACAAPAQEDAVDSTESTLTTQDPGTGVFDLEWTYGTPTGYSFFAKNSTDEYVRAGESMTFAVPAYFLWARLHPNDAMPNDPARLKQLSAKIEVVFVKGGAAYKTLTVKTTGWQGAQEYDLAATTPSFLVDKHAEGVRFELTAADAGDPAASATLGQGDFLEVAVLGGDLPNKTLLLDTMYSAMRQRVLEGGKPVDGADLAIAYTDWRAATLIDSSSIDRTVGTATTYGRFGAFDMPILADIEYEVSYGLGVDGAFQPEQALTADPKSRLMPPFGRTAYEGTLHVPAGAQKLSLYFHVKAYLAVDYSKYTNIKWKKYSQGDRIFVREKWDNEGGVAFHNYDFDTETP